MREREPHRCFATARMSTGTKLKSTSALMIAKVKNANGMYIPILSATCCHVPICDASA